MGGNQHGAVLRYRFFHLDHLAVIFVYLTGHSMGECYPTKTIVFPHIKTSPEDKRGLYNITQAEIGQLPIKRSASLIFDYTSFKEVLFFV